MKTGGDIIKVKVFVVFSKDPKTMYGKNTDPVHDFKIADVSQIVKIPAMLFLAAKQPLRTTLEVCGH